MPAPVFSLSVYGSAPNQYATEQALESGVNTALTALFDDLTANGGKAFASRALALAAGQEALPPALGLLFTREGSALVMRGASQAADDPLFGTYPQWGAISRIDTAIAMRDAGLMTLANVAGTGDAITADLPQAARQNGVTATSGTSIIEIIPIATNTGAAEPTLSIGGGAPVVIRSESGAVLSAGQLVAGRSYLLRRRNTRWHIVSGGVAMADVAAAIAPFLGRVAPVWGKVFSANTFPADVSTVLQRTESTWGIWVRTGAAGVPAELYQTDAAGQWWRRVVGDETIKEVRDIAASGNAWLTGIAGTADAITALMPAAYGAALPKTEDRLWFVPIETNETTGPTLAIGTAAARTLRDEKGVNLPPRRLSAGVPHLVRIASNEAADVIGAAIGLGELAALRNVANPPAVTAPFLPVVQSVATLPARPNAQVVYWHTWSDPTALMGDADLWVQQASPAVPVAPGLAEWELFDARTGDALVIVLSGMPARVPPLTAVEYRVNNGSWVRVNGAKPGDILTVGSLAAGQPADIAIRYRNYMGSGAASANKVLTPSTASFADGFNRANGILAGDGKWVHFGSGGTGNYALLIDANAVIAGANNVTYGARVVGEYFPPDQFVQVLARDTGAMSGPPRGVYLWARANAAVTDGYCLRLSGDRWYLERYRSGVPYGLGTGAIDTALLPAAYRLECRGTAIRVIRDGTQIFEAIDSGAERITSGSVALAIHNGASDGTGKLRVDDFLAGRAV